MVVFQITLWLQFFSFERNWQLSIALLRSWSASYRCLFSSCFPTHYSDVIMGVMASHSTNTTAVYSIVYSGADQRKQQSSASLAFVREIHRWPVNYPAQRASNAENVSIWWRHHNFGLHGLIPLVLVRNNSIHRPQICWLLKSPDHQ